MRNHSLYMLAVPMLICGCATTQANDPAVQKTTVEDSVTLRLAKSSEKVQAMMVDLSNLSTAQPSAKVKTESQSATDSSGLVTISWNGDAKPLVERLAKLKGYRFIATGKPYMAVPVAVEAKSKPYMDVLADIGAQMGKRADLVLKDGVLELRYREPI